MVIVLDPKKSVTLEQAYYECIIEMNQAIREQLSIALIESVSGQILQEGFKEKATTIFNRIKEAVTKFFNKVKNKFIELKSKIKKQKPTEEKDEKINEEIIEKADDTVEDLTGIFKDCLDKLDSRFEFLGYGKDDSNKDVVYVIERKTNEWTEIGERAAKRIVDCAKRSKDGIVDLAVRKQNGGGDIVAHFRTIDDYETIQPIKGAKKFSIYSNTNQVGQGYINRDYDK